MFEQFDQIEREAVRLIPQIVYIRICNLDIAEDGGKQRFGLFAWKPSKLEFAIVAVTELFDSQSRNGFPEVLAASLRTAATT